MLSFPAGIVSVLANNPSPAPLGFRIKNIQNLENMLPNKQRGKSAQFSTKPPHLNWMRMNEIVNGKATCYSSGWKSEQNWLHAPHLAMSIYWFYLNQNKRFSHGIILHRIMHKSSDIRVYGRPSISSVASYWNWRVIYSTHHTSSMCAQTFAFVYPRTELIDIHKFRCGVIVFVWRVLQSLVL